MHSHNCHKFKLIVTRYTEWGYEFYSVINTNEVTHIIFIHKDKLYSDVSLRLEYLINESETDTNYENQIHSL